MICLFRGTGPVAAAIRWQTRGAYAHAGWLCADGTFYEAHGACGVAHSLHPWVNNSGPCDVYGVRGLGAAQYREIKGFLRSQLGAGYDWLGVLRFLSGANRDNYARWFCSELVAEACERAGRPLLSADAWRVSPSVLAWSTELYPAKRRADLAWWEARFGRTGSVEGGPTF